MLALAEAGGISTSVTPLLAKLFIDSAVKRARQGIGLEDLPHDIPEIFIDYIRRSHPEPIPGTGIIPVESVVLAARVTAVVSLGDNFLPGDFRPDTALAALAERSLADPPILLDQLVSDGILERRIFGGTPVLRFSLDPAAEYLAAIEWIDRLRADRSAWKSFVQRLQGIEGYPQDIDGFLRALSACYLAYRVPLRLPDVNLPWEADDGSEPDH